MDSQTKQYRKVNVDAVAGIYNTLGHTVLAIFKIHFEALQIHFYHCNQVSHTNILFPEHKVHTIL